MANQPGVTVEFQDVSTAQTVPEAELPTVLIGPLYEVFEEEASDTAYDTTDSANQAFTWPSKRVGSVVDLAGTRNGRIDSQRKDLVDMIPVVKFRDGSTEYVIPDSAIEELSQTGFELTSDAKTDLDRGDFNVFVLSVDGEEFLYNPAGGLSDIEVTDQFLISSDGYTVSSVSSTRVEVNESLASHLSSSTRVEQDESASDSVSITPSTTAGRIVITVSGTDFDTEVGGTVAANDVVVTGVPLQGLTSLQGQLDSDLTTIDGLTFGVAIQTSDVEDFIVKVVSYDTDATYTTVDQTHFHTVSAVDFDSGTITLDSAVSGGADDDYVEVTILDSQVGYVESISVDKTQITAVVPDTFSDSLTFVDIYQTTTAITVYPEFEVLASYRALRSDIADVSDSYGSTSDFLEGVGHSAVDYRDVLGWAFQIVDLAQPASREIYFVPVDLEPDGGATGLPEDQDATTGFQNALEVAESLDVYNVVCLQKSTSIDAALQSHVTAMSTPVENRYRRGYLYQPVPLGDTESLAGEIAPGRVPGGVAASATDGNAVIRDSGVDFVTAADVVEGTEVVITFPSEFAGTRAALGSSTDNDLMLNGDDWTLTKEFGVDEGTYDVGVNTSAGAHVISGTPAFPNDSFVHVEAGDYVEVTISSTIYRLRVTSANAAGTELTTVDEVAGALDFGTGNTDNGSDLSVIRTWDNVQYYIDPLSKSQQVTALVDGKTLNNELFTLTLDYEPTMQIGTDENGNPETAQLDTVYTLAAIAAKRSGQASNDEITNLTPGGGISSVQYGYNHFRNSQLNDLSDGGFTLLSQRTAAAEPIVRDMITTDTSGSLVKQEEMAVANAHWIGKTLTNAFTKDPGQKLPLITSRLIGIRTLQLDALLNRWVEENRLVRYQIIDVSQNESNPRKLDMTIEVTLPLAEKEVDIVIQRTV